MSAFLSGAGGVECGPSNVLKNVQTRVDRDHSLHQDRLVSTPNVAGSSRQPFRTPPSIAPSAQTAQPARSRASPFDLSSLRHHLSPPPPPQLQRQASPAARVTTPSAGWVDAFNAHVQAQAGPPAQNGWSHEFVQHVSTPPLPDRSIPHGQVGPPPWQYQPHQPMYQQPYMDQFRTLPQPPQHAIPRPTDQISALPPESQASTAPTQVPREPLTESQDLLARTAQSFVSELDDPTSTVLRENPKLAQSNFMGLLRGLGTGGVVIQEGEQGEGQEVGQGARLISRNDIPSSDWAKDFAVQGLSSTTKTTQNLPSDDLHDVQPRILPAYDYGTPNHNHAAMMPSLDPFVRPSQNGGSQLGQMNDASWESEFQDQEALIQSSENLEAGRKKNVHFDSASSAAQRERSGVPNTLEEALASSTFVPGSGAAWEEEGFDLEDLEDFNDEVFMGFNGMMRQAAPVQFENGVGEKQGWGKLQKDWDEFKRAEPGEKGMRGMGLGDKAERYLFESRNPYFAQTAGEEVQIPMDSPTLKGVLELEAEVQHFPTSPEAWYSLGLKQQENEREDQAILALSKVVQLEPSYRPAYLALAVSYTNEGEAEAACTMLERWIRLGEEAQRILPGSSGERYGTWGRAGREELIERLIEVARRNPQEVDADVQVALGVLFNGTEEYLKAEDCFLAALDVRPDDWLLYNRLGATLANSGRSNEAIHHYHKALSLHPHFVRALFNLGISYNNLGQYALGAQSALDALRIQHSDSSEAYMSDRPGTKGVTSDALWTALKGACAQMNRHDLIPFAERRDLSGFPASFADNAAAVA